MPKIFFLKVHTKKCKKVPKSVFFLNVSKIGDFIVTMLLSALVERVRFEESLDESVFQYLLVNFFFGFVEGFQKLNFGQKWRRVCGCWCDR